MGQGSKTGVGTDHIAIMNLMLHRRKAPDIDHTNTPSENVPEILEKDRCCLVLGNPGSTPHRLN